MLEAPQTVHAANSSATIHDMTAKEASSQRSELGTRYLVLCVQNFTRASTAPTAIQMLRWYYGFRLVDDTTPKWWWNCVASMEDVPKFYRACRHPVYSEKQEHPARYIDLCECSEIKSCVPCANQGQNGKGGGGDLLEIRFAHLVSGKGALRPTAAALGAFPGLLVVLGFQGEISQPTEQLGVPWKDLQAQPFI